MNRKPTPDDKLYAWHTQMLAHMATAGTNRGGPRITESEPQCGWYMRRLIKDGPYHPARIFVERDTDPETGDLISDEKIRCEVDGQRRDPFREWTWLASRPITEDQYMDMLAGGFALPRDEAPPDADPRPEPPPQDHDGPEEGLPAEPAPAPTGAPKTCF